MNLCWTWYRKNSEAYNKEKIPPDSKHYLLKEAVIIDLPGYSNTVVRKPYEL